LRFENRVASDITLFSDREKLRMVVKNLLDNAVEYTAAGGEIVVESDGASGRVLEVRDSGPGIPEHALASVFGPFVRLESARSASGKHCGIGLTLARALCDALGLSVAAHNRADGWVAFEVRDRSRVEGPQASGLRPQVPNPGLLARS